MRLALLICILSAQTVVAQRKETKTTRLYTIQVIVEGHQLKAVRASVMGKNKATYAPQGAVVRRTTKKQPYFYARPKFKLQLPAGEYSLTVAAGTEYVPVKVTLKADSDMTTRVKLYRWSWIAKEGWYAGDSHVHLHTGGPIRVTTRDALLAAEAEGIHYSNLCVSNNVGDDIRDANLITGKPHPNSTATHLLVFGEEMRSMIYGHMQFFGISKFVEPQYTGFKNTPNSHDFPANYTMAANATRQGGIVTYGHPMFKGKPLPFDKDLTADNAAARELPIDAALGVCQAVDLMCYNSDEDLSTELYYKLLNCGLKLSACVGTDALLDRSTDPVGGSRVYVHVKGKLTQPSWLAGLRAGRTFVTNGPVVLLSVDDKAPGDTLSLAKEKEVLVHCRVRSYVPVTSIEIIVNGKVVQHTPVKRGKNQRFNIVETVTKIKVAKSSWFAARVRGPDHAHLFDGPAFAHTSPIYVKVGGRPIESAKDATYFVEWINQLIRVVQVRNRYKKPADRDQVIAIFRKAQARFAKMAAGK